MNLNPGTVQALPGSTVRVPLKVAGFNNISGFQFTLNWDASQLQFARISNQPNGLAYNAQRAGNGILTVSWDEISGSSLSLPDGSTMMYAEFTVLASAGTIAEVSLNGSLTPTEAFDQNLNRLTLPHVSGAVNVVNQITSIPTKANNGYALLPNVPNPFGQATGIRFMLPTDESVSVSITNTLGQVVHTQEGIYSAGINSMDWLANENLPSGTYNVSLKAGNFIGNRRITLNR